MVRYAPKSGQTPPESPEEMQQTNFEPWARLAGSLEGTGLGEEGKVDAELSRDWMESGRWQAGSDALRL